jgi:hypothetical protein
MNAYPRNEAEAHAEMERANAFPTLPNSLNDDHDPGPILWPLIALWLVAAVVLITAVMTTGCSSTPSAQMDAERTALAVADVERHGASLRPLSRDEIAWLEAQP